MHHLCLEVEDLAGLLRQLAEAGVELVAAAPRPGAHGSRVAFIHPRATHGVLIELMEAGSGGTD
jgi:methylmalonyl-CoA/ethylmalonyl-CoA epimerase